jgi:hypothetical protein
MSGRGLYRINLVMNRPEFLNVDPCSLYLPVTRPNGADPVKLQRQIAQYGSSTEGIPPILVYRGSDGALIIFDGVTRANRIAKLRLGVLALYRTKINLLKIKIKSCNYFRGSRILRFVLS